MEDISARVNSLKEEGNAYFGRGDAGNAVESYSKGLELDKENHFLYSNRAAAYLKLSKLEEAVADARECTRLAPEWAKGYIRLAQTLLRLGELKECEKVVDMIHSLEPDNRNIKQLVESIGNKRAFAQLKGNWFGRVSPELGGYIQTFEFRSESQVMVSVFGRAILARLRLNTSISPGWLDLLVETEPGQPSAPEVKHIFKIDQEDVLHLCSPYMTSPEERPTTFEGPAYVVMKRGTPPVDENAVAEKKLMGTLSPTEKCERFAKDVIELLPDYRIAPFATDSDARQAEIMLENVRFQTSYFDIKEKYGDETEEFVKFYLEGSVVCPTPKLAALVEVLRNKMQVCGLFPSDEELEGAQPAAVPAPPAVEVATSKIALDTAEPVAVTPAASREESKDETFSTNCIALTGVVALTAAIVAVVLFRNNQN